MEITISQKELQKRKIFVATPMYGGQCHGNYCKSSVDLANLCNRYNIKLKFYYLYNESLITRARNYCADEFLRSDCTHLMFIDSDISYKAEDVLSLAALDKDIIGGAYPKKTIAWEKIYKACHTDNESIKREIEKDPKFLQHFIGDFVFNPIEDTKTINLNEPVEVSEIGTGFMMIKKEALEKFSDYHKLTYKPDHLRSEHFSGDRDINIFFDTVVDPKSRRYLSEDYMFCRYAIQAGLTVWLCPWMEFQHIGTFHFGSSLKAMASINTHHSYDKNEVLDNKKTTT